MTRVYNFSPGPAMLPESVLQRIKDELFDWNNTGVSIMELTHRGDAFFELVGTIEKNLRSLYSIPDHYRVLFIPGGARVQFAMIPLNLMRDRPRFDYVDTGFWGRVAINEAKKYGDVHVVTSTEQHIADQSTWTKRKDAAYLHYTANETINGVEFRYIPQTEKDIPLVADMTSNILSEPLDISRFGIVYAASQKNMGIAGLTLMIVREDLMGHAHPMTPNAFDFAVQYKERSMFTTPPTFVWYVLGLMIEWMIAEGGLAEFAKRNQRKAQKLYDAIDSDPLYQNTVAPECRSWMNVPYQLTRRELENQFLDEAQAIGLAYLRGHKVAGGVRASLYNAMPEVAVDRLVQFMKDFSSRYG